MMNIPSGIIDAVVDSDLDAAKSNCRKQSLRRRSELADAEPDAATILADRAKQLVCRFGCGIYAGYFPIRCELSPIFLMKRLFDIGCDIALPVTPAQGEPLTFHHWRVNGPLDDGPYGTKQPPSKNKICTPDVILVPMLAFDSDGWRLGYGGGFYDRTLAALRSKGLQISVIGVAYEGQELDKVPVGPYDMPLNAVLFPGGLFEPKESSNK